MVEITCQLIMAACTLHIIIQAARELLEQETRFDDLVYFFLACMTIFIISYLAGYYDRLLP